MEFASASEAVFTQEEQDAIELNKTMQEISKIEYVRCKTVSDKIKEIFNNGIKSYIIVAIWAIKTITKR